MMESTNWVAFVTGLFIGIIIMIILFSSHLLAV